MTCRPIVLVRLWMFESSAQSWGPLAHGCFICRRFDCVSTFDQSAFSNCLMTLDGPEDFVVC